MCAHSAFFLRVIADYVTVGGSLVEIRRLDGRYLGFEFLLSVRQSFAGPHRNDLNQLADVLMEIGYHGDVLGGLEDLYADCHRHVSQGVRESRGDTHLSGVRSERN